MNEEAWLKRFEFIEKKYFGAFNELSDTKLVLLALSVILGRVMDSREPSQTALTRLLRERSEETVRELSVEQKA
jgi:hypothetical protein